jgi:hypothetical protein
MQLQPVISSYDISLIGKTGLMQQWIHEIAGTITGKRPTGAVGTVSPWSQPH